MGGKFEVPAGKHCWKLADRLSVMVYLLGLKVPVGWPTCGFVMLYWWGRQLLDCRRPCGITASTRTAAGTRS